MRNIFCMGDSLTSAFYPYYLKKQIRAENKIRTDIINLGIPGINSTGYLSFLKANIYYWSSLSGKISLLLLGTNDIRLGFKFTNCRKFNENMEKIIELLKKNGFEIILSLIPPVTRTVFPYYTSFSIRRINSCINPAISILSKKYKIPAVDNYKGMSGQVFADGVHPELSGYRKMAENWHEVLKTIIQR